MDPNTCLQRIADADTRREAREACEALYAWLNRGGFEPDWKACPTGTSVYRRWRRGAYD